jgi:hypothetical protein
VPNTRAFLNKDFKVAEGLDLSMVVAGD